MMGVSDERDSCLLELMVVEKNEYNDALFHYLEENGLVVMDVCVCVMGVCMGVCDGCM